MKLHHPINLTCLYSSCVLLCWDVRYISRLVLSHGTWSMIVIHCPFRPYAVRILPKCPRALHYTACGYSSHHKRAACFSVSLNGCLLQAGSWESLLSPFRTPFSPSVSCSIDCKRFNRSVVVSEPLSPSMWACLVYPLVACNCTVAKYLNHCSFTSFFY